ncbi:hypothetical protein GFL91_06465 [Rhizobium leguminosarum bv. viciae]|uniref:Uncharacterized protein n=1 Tax=Rhizobium leguminosarum bv. viciae TaxID=387 RepID=A0A8I2GMJ3_RHILV|nr:hypothetical protein [Rhizobium leguminosarum bv. viciae]TBY80140.1 hypothetical protein E0H51_02295 [Rhizobium leguminosarum bv. viciae]
MTDAKLPSIPPGNRVRSRLQATEIQVGPKIAFLLYLVKRNYDGTVNFCQSGLKSFGSGVRG